MSTFRTEIPNSNDIVEKLLEDDEYLSGILRNIIRKKLETLALDDTGTTLVSIVSRIELLEAKVVFIEESLRITETNYNERSLKDINTRIRDLENMIGNITMSLGFDYTDFNERRLDNINFRLRELELILENHEEHES